MPVALTERGNRIIVSGIRSSATGSPVRHFLFRSTGSGDPHGARNTNDHGPEKG